MCKSCGKIEKSKKSKKLSKVEKDLPRFKVIMEYEKEFKMNYATAISEGLKKVLKTAKKHT